jgi:hypothetical protein
MEPNICITENCNFKILYNSLMFPSISNVVLSWTTIETCCITVLCTKAVGEEKIP